MAYLWFKSFHIVGVAAWFTGLFYLPRLFVYHIEAEEKPEPIRSVLREEYSRIEQLLYKLIMMPAMIFTVMMAIGIISTEPQILQKAWLQVKLLLVLLLIGFHFCCGQWIQQLQNGTCSISSLQMRRINEIPTILLSLVILLVVFKGALPTATTAVGIGVAILVFAIIIQLYARKRGLQNSLGVPR